MKAMKKIMALALSLIMMLAMSVTAFADDTTTNKIAAKSDDTHTYEVYQIFTGTLANGVLSDVKWGTNGTGTTGEAVSDDILTELKNVNNGTDTEILAVVEKYASLSNPVAEVTSAKSYEAAAGYYLIKDKDNSVAGTDSYTKYIVKVVGDVTIARKADVPSFQKKIKDTNDSEANSTTDWQDSADYDIGDAVPFQLKGTVASNYADYTKYYFAFHDVEEKGLTFDATSVKVYVDGTQITTGYRLVTTGLEDGCSFEVIFDDLKTIDSVHANSVITVEYSSTLNENANLGSQGNVNKAKLEFSNNPNDKQGGEHGSTEWDNVIVFTYKVVVNKYANQVSDTTKLSGAEFKLEKKLADGTTKTIATVKSEDGTSFTFKGLDDGDYVLTETTTPAGYNTIAPITFTVNAEHKIEWTTGERTDVLTKLSGEKASGNITFTASEDKSELATNVINKSGATLPSTGGMGTTIFYVVGVVLMLGAAVFMITRKRMSAER